VLSSVPGGPSGSDSDFLDALAISELVHYIPDFFSSEQSFMHFKRASLESLISDPVSNMLLAKI
jgi:hypothetical protein